MSETFYIEQDEEIISVVARLRQSSSLENYFVFPKRALVLQSIINLRLFQREAQKLGKKIIIVTQDEQGRTLASKAGIETEDYSEDRSQKSIRIELPNEQPVPAPVAASKPIVTGSLHSESIGSPTFYGSRDARSTPVSPVMDTKTDARFVRVRDSTPVQQTSLNSLRGTRDGLGQQPDEKDFFGPEKIQGTLPVQPVDRKPETYRSHPKTAGAVGASSVLPPASSDAATQSARLQNFFSPSGKPPLMSRSDMSVTRKQPSPSLSTGSKAHWFFYILGGVSLVSIIGVFFFLFLPQAEIHIVPRYDEQNVDRSFDGRSDVPAGGSDSIPVRLIEKEQEIDFPVQATGKTDATNQKARGSVIISNSYSTDPQPLIATTRFVDPDGKVFRLVDSITVPGMAGAQPGIVEAAVIADQPGSEYDIQPTTFTIPGFKDSQKYGKFSAKSVKTMIGGANGGTEISVITRLDLERAQSDALKKVKEAFLAEVRQTLQPDEKILEEVIEATSRNVALLPASGTPAETFDFHDTYRIRSFVFSEKAIREKIFQRMTTDNQSGIRPVRAAITYGESIPDYDHGTVNIRTHALVRLEPIIDIDQIRLALLGKDERGLKAYLDTSTMLSGITVDFKPRWFGLSTVPSSASRVTIVVDSGE